MRPSLTRPKARSTTTSSKSATSSRTRKPKTNLGLDTPVQFVKGVGPRMGVVFNNRGIVTVRDLLGFFPRSYEDRSQLQKVNQLMEGDNASVELKILSVRKIPIRARNRTILDIRCQDETGQMNLKWFYHNRYLSERLKPGREILATGKVKFYMSRPEIVHPELTFGTAEQASQKNTQDTGRIIPIYTEIEGVSTRLLRKVLWNAVEKYADQIEEDLPAYMREAHRLPSLKKSIRWIHFPEFSSGKDGEQQVKDLLEFKSPAHWRLIYEEFLKFEYLVLKQRLKMTREPSPPVEERVYQSAVTDLKKLLPFQLTNGQEEALKDISDDLLTPYPMNRLIQGDVGSGKTAVSFLSAAGILADGGQAVLMAPTEILAEQHFKNAVKLFGGRLNVALLTGKTTAAERSKLLPRLQNGEPILLIGTHALIEDPVVFKNLNLVMIDEQHRFGVEQRRTIRNKGVRKVPAGKTKLGRYYVPNILILTATPIPRTLALTAYGDLNVSSIRELPPGRSPIKTHVVKKSRVLRAYEKIGQELAQGRQAYFIYPLVNQSEAEGFSNLKSAIAEAERLQKEVFPQYKVGLLHGQLNSQDKARIMGEFERNEIQVLVSTTVVEVGVDVPNSTIMAIEHSERFGLSQLHQLRGRVGRGKHQSYCFLFCSDKPGETSAHRLDVLEKTTDGFKIAEADLEIRGPGEFLGTRQSGTLPFRVANIVRDQIWLLKARDDAGELLKSDPELRSEVHQPLRRYYVREGKIQSERLKTS